MLSEDYTKGYVSGFIDADGSFSVSIKVQRDVRYGVRIDPVFSVTQRNREVLEFLRRVLGCGRIIKKPGQENLWLYIVDRVEELNGKLLRFLEDGCRLIVKDKQLKLFTEIVKGLIEKRHYSYEGIKKLVHLSYELSSLGGKAVRRRSLNEVLTIIEGYEMRRRDAPGER